MSILGCIYFLNLVLAWMLSYNVLLAFNFVFWVLFAGADNLVTKLTDKINTSSNHKLILAHLPLIMVCIEVGKVRSKKVNHHIWSH